MLLRSILKKTNAALSRIFRFGACAALAGVFLIVFINAVRRYTIGKSFEWGEELPVYLAIYGVMFGCALAVLQGRHGCLGLFIDPLPQRLKDTALLFSDMLMIFIGGLLAWSGWLFTLQRGRIESSGLVGTANDLIELTGLEWLYFFGQLYPWQFALCLGGVMISLAAIVTSSLRLLELREGGG